MASMRSTLNTTCNGKTTCDLPIGLSDLAWQGGQANAPSAGGVCGSQAYMYAQVGCVIDSQYTVERRIFGLLIGCIGVFVYLFTVVYYDYIKAVQSNSYIEWDVKTITAGDYTIEFDLKPETYDYWKKHYYCETNAMTECAQFKIYV